MPTADLLLVKHVLHDWPDDACIKILRNCRNALLPGGRIVVVEMLVDETHPSRFIAQFDLTMLTVVGGKERTLEEYRRLFNLGAFVLNVLPRQLRRRSCLRSPSPEA